jgi:hypothetical protein
MLSLSLLTLSPTPSLWHFEGPLAYQAQQWIQGQYGESLTNHLFDESALQSHINSLERPTQVSQSSILQACVLNRLAMNDRNSCDLDSLLLKEASLGGHIFLYANVEGSRFMVKLLVEKLNEEPKLYEAQGDDLKSTGRQVIERAFGMGRYNITGIPKLSRVFVDGVEVGRGNGAYVVTAGEHTLKVTTPDYQDYNSKFTIKIGQKISEEVKLLSASAILETKILHEEELKALKVVLDDVELKPEQYHQSYEVPPGKHTILVTATDREPIKREFDLAPGETGKLVLNLQYDRAPWKIALNQPHEETKVGQQQISFRVQTQTLRAGAWQADIDGNTGGSDKIRAQTTSMNGFGFDVGFSWLLRDELGVGPMRLDVLGYNFEYFSDAEVSEELTLDNGSISTVQKVYELSSLSRHKIRLLWAGYQLPMWRVTPYFQTGLLWVYERGELSKGSSGTSGTVSNHNLRVGWELGVDVRLSSTWVVKASMVGDLWPGERTAVQTLIGGAYAFDAMHSPLL